MNEIISGHNSLVWLHPSDSWSLTGEKASGTLTWQDKKKRCVFLWWKGMMGIKMHD